MASTLVLKLMSKASEKGTNLRGVAREVGIPDEVAKNWIRGKAEPTKEQVKLLCNKMGIPVIKDGDTASTKEDKKELFATTTKVTIEEHGAPTAEELENMMMAPPERFVVDEASPAADFMPQPVKEEKEAKEEKEKKEEKKMNEAVHTESVTAPVAAEEKPKRTRSASPKKTGKKQLFSEESESFIRKSVGLKKSEEITEKAVAEAFKSGMSAVKQKMDELARLEREVTKALYAKNDTPPVDERLTKLLEAAGKASDEGIAVAITILEKFKK